MTIQRSSAGVSTIGSGALGSGIGHVSETG